MCGAAVTLGELFTLYQASRNQVEWYEKKMALKKP